MWRTLRWSLLGGGGVVYIYLGFLATSSRNPPLFAVLAGAIPIALGLLAACWRSPFRYPATVACLAVFALIGWRIDLLVGHAAWLYFIQHAGTMAALAAMFGLTLGSHESALCSRIALVAIAQPLDADYLRYTWQVTLAWTVYFISCALLSVMLFFAARLDVWSWFAAVATPVSVGLMFLGEYLIRLRALPGRPHFSIAQTVRSYRQYSQKRDCIE